MLTKEMTIVTNKNNQFGLFWLEKQCRGRGSCNLCRDDWLLLDLTRYMCRYFYCRYIHIFSQKHQHMQGAAEALKNDIWSKLGAQFQKYQNKDGEIDVKRVEQIVVEVLHEESQNEIDYVMKNMFRVDVDNSGSVSFTELGNFLFKRHCGQMALQRDHKVGKMSRGSERKMTLEEFNRLINNAYKFLNVTFPNDVCEYVFKSVDKDNDNLITYVEYFKVIEIYVCKGKDEAPVAKPEPVGPERHSRLRIHLWGCLRQLYEYYIQGRALEASDAELRRLIIAILGDLAEADITFLAAGILRVNFKTITFEPFAENFIYLLAELGLSRYSRNNPGKKTLNRDQFVLLLTNTFGFAKLQKFKKTILYKIFAKIDKNNDGLISFEEYLDWVKRFLAVLKYFGDEFYVEEDDWDLDNSDPFEKDLAPPPAPPKPTQKIMFTFSSYLFAKQVRERVLECLIPYDTDKDHLFTEEEIKNALVGLLKESEHELQYVTRNVFRYDRDNDKCVTYDELTNFCVEQHFGEMAIQRLHKKKFYEKGSQRIMNKAEFGKTLNIALEYIQMTAPQEVIDVLFSEIDLDHDGWISYEVYFLFLRYYFGSLSPVLRESFKVEKPAPPPLTDYEQFLLKYKDLSAFDRFVRIILDQLRDIFFRYDTNKNLVFELDEIRQILEKVFEFDENEISYIIYTYFGFLQKNDDSCTFEQLIAIILSIYFIEILFHRRYKSTNSEIWTAKKISLEEFIILILEGCYFIKFKPTRQDLEFIFGVLDTDKDGYITFQQFVDFIRKYLGNDIDPWALRKKKDANPAGVSEEQYNFVNAIWDELKAYFDKYDQAKKGYLNDEELRKFAIEVLNETTERELNYIFWNMFRVDSDGNKQVEFPEFAPFILNHAGEISLQKFHREQIKGKNTLTDEELYVVLSNAYRFLSSMPKQRSTASIIHSRIQKDGSVSYGAYMSWVHHALAAKYVKK